MTPSFWSEEECKKRTLFGIMRPIEAIFFHPREVPPSCFAMDTLRAYPLSPADETLMSATMPKYSKFDASQGKVLRRYNSDFDIIHSIDPNAYLLLNMLRVDIGAGLFALPSGRTTFATQVTLFHQGEVTIEHRLVHIDLSTALTRVDINLVIGNGKGDFILLLLAGGTFSRRDKAQGPNNSVCAQELLDAGLVFLQP
jgi:hypothetical protein